MDLAIVLSLVQTILTAIQTLNQLKDTFSFSLYEKELDRLLKTVNAIQSVLRDADSMQDALNDQQRHYIEELKDVIYDADDVLDEFLTLVKRKKLTADNHTLPRKVRSFFSRFSRTSRNLSNKVEQVNEKLDLIASNSSKFLFKIDNKVKRFTKEESCSFLSKNDKIIGREEDVEKITEMLLQYDDVDQPNILSVSIVGMGGLGKTALAQLVYNDLRVTSAFESKYWICIGDQDEKQWSLSVVLGKVVTELARGNTRDLGSLELMRDEVEKHLGEKKYLLVLDDVWTEDYNRWVGFINFLKIGKSGSRLLVTTRSKKTAKIVGGQVHELKGLSNDESWCLFERMAFRPEQRKTPDDHLVKLGEEIVKKCGNIPLAIRVVGSLLLDELKSKWELFLDKGFGNINENGYDTMNHILKLSYNQLSASLKSCFTYCAIFPKDFEIEKSRLIRLWMAQGYISTEYVGEEYYRVLLQRCFFQDVNEGYRGEVFKIHDLLHDIAEQAAGKEICRLNSCPLTFNKELRHLGLLDRVYPEEIFNKAHIRNKSHIRTLLPVGSEVKISIWINLIGNLTCLRSLDLQGLYDVKLPDSIGELFHLRCLDLSDCSYLKALPKSITKLVNLQTLILRNCGGLKELPNDMYKLVDLSTLDISGCYGLGHLPPNLGTLIKLHTMGELLVGGETTYEKQCFDGLKDLHSLNNLKGSLEINIKVHKHASYKKEEHGGGAYLINKHLSVVFFRFRHRKMEQCKNEVTSKNIEWEESLLEDMQPPVDIKCLRLHGYAGEAIPRWPSREDNSTLFYLPNLVRLFICFCPHLLFLPPLEKLPNLQDLELDSLPNVEYVVNVNVLEACSLIEGSSFYPCLKRLEIVESPKLKGWWPGSEEQNEALPCFGKLRSLKIKRCDMLEFIPICSSLSTVIIKRDYRSSLDRVERHNLEQLPESYQSLLPSDSKSRFITISDFDVLTDEAPANTKWESICCVKSVTDPSHTREERIHSITQRMLHS